MKKRLVIETESGAYCAEVNRNNGNWDIVSAGDDVVPDVVIRCGFATREAAETAILGMDAWFDERLRNYNERKKVRLRRSGDLKKGRKRLLPSRPRSFSS